MARRLPAVHCRFAWWISACNCGPISSLLSRLLIQGIALNCSFLRRFTIWSRISWLSVARAESSVACTCLAFCAAPEPPAYNSNAATANTPMNTRKMIPNIAVNLLPLVIDRSFFLEQARRQNDARDAQPVEELGSDAGRLERSNHLAVGSDPFLVECENFLHADHVLFHTRDLGDAGYLARAVAHARGLHHDADGRRDLLAHRFFRQIHVAHGHH